MVKKRKLMFLQFLFAFILLMLLLSIVAIIGELLEIAWIIKYTNTGFFIGNIVGALLGIYNIVVPIVDREIFKELGMVFYFLLAIGFFCFLINVVQIFEFFGFNISFL